jgi:glutamate formiminotransferase
MNRPLVESVPNFSEGRRRDVIEAIVSAMRGAAPVYVLDTSSDPDHNRTVVTFAGTPDAVERAMFAGQRMLCRSCRSVMSAWRTA